MIIERIARPLWQRVAVLRTPTITKIEIKGTVVEYRQDTLAKVNEVDSLMKEEQYIRKILNEINSGDIVWDVGAHHGIISALIAKIDESSQVIAFEPVQENLSILRDTIKRNGVEDRVKIVQEPLADRNREVGFHTQSNTTAGRHRLTNSEQPPKVKTISGNQLISEGKIPSPDIIKIDVEGAEYLVLKGLNDSLTSVRTLFIELHPIKYEEWEYDGSDISNFLTERGYDICHVSTKRGDDFIIARDIEAVS